MKKTTGEIRTDGRTQAALQAVKCERTLGAGDKHSAFGMIESTKRPTATENNVLAR